MSQVCKTKSVFWEIVHHCIDTPNAYAPTNQTWRTVSTYFQDGCQKLASGKITSRSPEWGVYTKNWANLQNKMRAKFLGVDIAALPDDEKMVSGNASRSLQAFGEKMKRYQAGLGFKNNPKQKFKNNPKQKNFVFDSPTPVVDPPPTVVKAAVRGKELAKKHFAKKSLDELCNMNVPNNLVFIVEEVIQDKINEQIRDS